MRALRHHAWIVAALVVGASGAFTIACRDSALGPSAVNDTTYASFTVKPTSKSTFSIDVHKIVFAPGAVCDPAVSTYGPTEWDNPCVAASAPITVSTKSWIDSSGHPRVDFSPALRFVPNKTVLLYLKDKTAVLDPSANIVWCPDAANECVDESTTDASLATQTDLANGFVYRRVKHFSAYNVTTGWYAAGR